MKSLNEMINEALTSTNPLSVVPSIDEIGHGSIMAGVAAGSKLNNGDFIGAAPDSNIAVVKLKEAKPYKNEKPIVYYGSSITQGGCASRPGNAYQAVISRRYDADFINLGFSYLFDLAKKLIKLLKEKAESEE